MQIFFPNEKQTKNHRDYRLWNDNQKMLICNIHAFTLTRFKSRTTVPIKKGIFKANDFSSRQYILMNMTSPGYRKHGRRRR